MSIVLLEWNDLELALQYARDYIDTCKQWGQVDALADGYLQLSRVLQVIGKQNEATVAMQKAEQIVQQYSPKISAYMSANLTRLYLKQGKREAISNWLDHCGLDIDDHVEIADISLYIILARALLIQGEQDKALDLLIRLDDIIDKTDLLVFQIEILILQAIAWQAKKDEDKAQSQIRQALTKAKPQEFIRIFIEEGLVMENLLRKLLVDGYEVEYIRKLLSAMETNANITNESIEMLTDRELEILRLLTTPATHAEIAQQLYISRNTVRSHVKRIYSKLNASNRIQVIEKARASGLIA